jgi:hypothetical protein
MMGSSLRAPLFALALVLACVLHASTAAADDDRVGGDALTAAVLHGDVDELRGVLARGVAADPKDASGQSALGLNTSLNCSRSSIAPDVMLAITDVLLAAGANPSAVNDRGRVVLVMAAQYCRPLLIEKLLAAGADIERRDVQGYSALSMALVVGNYDVARTLVARCQTEQGHAHETFSAPGRRAARCAAASGKQVTAVFRADYRTDRP